MPVNTPVLALISIAALLLFCGAVCNAVGLAYVVPDGTDVFFPTCLVQPQQQQQQQQRQTKRLTAARLAAALRTEMTTVVRNVRTAVHGAVHAVGGRAPAIEDDSLTTIDDAPLWWETARNQASCRQSAAICTGLAILPVLFVTVVVFYASESDMSKFSTKLPLAAMWTTLAVAAFSLISNSASTMPSVMNAAGLFTEPRFDPAAFAPATSYGVGLTNIILCVAALVLTIVALAKR